MKNIELGNYMDITVIIDKTFGIIKNPNRNIKLR